MGAEVDTTLGELIGALGDGTLTGAFTGFIAVGADLQAATRMAFSRIIRALSCAKSPIGIPL